MVQDGNWYAIELFINGMSAGFIMASGNGYNPYTLKGYVRKTAEWFDETFKDILLENLKKEEFKVAVTYKLKTKPRMINVVTNMNIFGDQKHHGLTNSLLIN